MAPTRNVASVSDTNGAFKSEDTFRILLATDNHIGYKEGDAVLKDDSFEAFEEILQLAVEHEVDFVLLGGDLFHDNKPSRETLFRTMSMFRKHCLGDRDVTFQVVSDRGLHFPLGINYESPNFNIGVPVFGIHGNHDDPTGVDEKLSTLDLLNVSGVLNYFGKVDNVDLIQLFPVLFQKGSTKVALYGLGNIRDERLYNTWEKQNVKFMRPSSQDDDWFNLFAIHQNRNQYHTARNCIPESMLPSFLNFVLWGHEHECRVYPERFPQGFEVCQLGSSVATSLVKEEAKEKHVALLEVCGVEHRVTPLPLKSVRPFFIQDLSLKDFDEINARSSPDEIEECLQEVVEKLLGNYAEPGAVQGTKEKLPLIRLRVDVSGEDYQLCNPRKFGQAFVNRVANPSDILLYTRSRARKGAGANANEVDEASDERRSLAERVRMELEKDNDRLGQSDNAQLETLLSEQLTNNASKASLQLVIEPAFRDALREFIDKDEKDAFIQVVDKTVDGAQKFVKNEIGTKVGVKGQNGSTSRQSRKLTLDGRMGRIANTCDDGGAGEQDTSMGGDDDDVSEVKVIDVDVIGELQKYSKHLLESYVETKKEENALRSLDRLAEQGDDAEGRDSERDTSSETRRGGSKAASGRASQSKRGKAATVSSSRSVGSLKVATTTKGKTAGGKPMRQTTLNIRKMSATASQNAAATETVVLDSDDDDTRSSRASVASSSDRRFSRAKSKVAAPNVPDDSGDGDSDYVPDSPVLSASAQSKTRKTVGSQRTLALTGSRGDADTSVSSVAAATPSSGKRKRSLPATLAVGSKKRATASTTKRLKADTGSKEDASSTSTAVAARTNRRRGRTLSTAQSTGDDGTSYYDSAFK